MVKNGGVEEVVSLKRPDNTRSKLADFLASSRGKMIAVAYSWGHNRDRAEDAVQEAARRVLASGSYDGVSNFEPWFWRIMRNAYLDALKKSDEKNDSIDMPPMETIEGDGYLTFADVHPGPDRPAAEVMESDADALRVRQVLDSLRPKMRAALRRVDMDGQSYADTARGLGWPRGALGSTISRAREAFRKKWRKEAAIRGGSKTLKAIKGRKL